MNQTWGFVRVLYRFVLTFTFYVKTNTRIKDLFQLLIRRLVFYNTFVEKGK